MPFILYRFYRVTFSSSFFFGGGRGDTTTNTCFTSSLPRLCVLFPCFVLTSRKFFVSLLLFCFLFPGWMDCKYFTEKSTLAPSLNKSCCLYPPHPHPPPPAPRAQNIVDVTVHVKNIPRSLAPERRGSFHLL